MANEGRIPKYKIAPGTEAVMGPASAVGPINPRQGQPPEHTVSDQQIRILSYIAAGIANLAEQNQNMARSIENRSRLVDEYESQGYTVATETTLTVQPTYDLTPEKIESILVVGPAGAVTVTIGDRVWPLTIPASGILVIAPVAILIGRNDTRSVVGTNGNYFLELMGVSDERFDA